MEEGPTCPRTLSVPNTAAKLEFYKLGKKGGWLGVENRGVCPTMYQF